MAALTSYMQGAHDFRIDNLAISHSLAYTRGALEYLEEHIATGAFHNSSERSDAPTCHPETRTAVQEDILGWITDEGSEDYPRMKMMWLSGPAGSGKTAIAGSIAEVCQERDILAGSFFFSSYSASPERHSKGLLIVTLAYQLLQHDGLEGMEQYVLKAIQRDPAIFKKRLKDQLQALILKPLRKFAPSGDLPRVLIIDGVDEVQAGQPMDPSKPRSKRADEEDQLEVISCLLQAAKDQAFPFRILVVSRPERVFTEFFATHRDHIKRVFLDESYEPDADIEVYLTARFAGLRYRYRLDSGWPGDGIVRRLVANASGQFIYAATVVRFVADGTDPPPSQLERLLKIRPHDLDTNPFGTLDALYTHVLMGSPSPRLAATWLLALNATSSLPARFCRLLLEKERGQGEHILRPLASLIFIPDPPQDQELGYRVYHKSLLDFLSDERRCPAPIFGSGERPGWATFLGEAWLALLMNKGSRVPATPLENDYFINVALRPQSEAFIFWELAEACYDIEGGALFAARCRILVDKQAVEQPGRRVKRFLLQVEGSR
ncbi:hypothetical protein FA13DRAFT_113183 [Coprinellus micaceus]|uniref:Nephrocystin 3-like N-terminal domain-containing protein n=1 Tax=Coprinellus micaceus TaxID=71717 RepID=A0A4Y7TJT8_COPMI|nr:hypothetical protein FA13DRAFT_113183 [Coprinellus micaceus]